ncbi:hypothetical protein [Pelobacter seleniigenes]|uniref:hypothetical protein n=1 Tax=Pelobacter seleniigenes TaxID=407188 RepID=UPI0004A6ED79|nr:hypothetical protein [Pelobacter seleniigenes]
MIWTRLSLAARRRLGSSLILLVLLAVIMLPATRSLVFDNSLLQRVDQATSERVEESLTRAVAVFAMARLTNGVISVIQESQLELAPAGLGLNLALGQILDPLNDLVERFSWVMLAAVTSLGIQRFLIAIGPWFAVEILGALALLLWLIGLWLPAGKQPLQLLPLARKMVLLAVVVRFAVPLAASLNEAVYQSFLAADYTRATAVIASGNEELQQLSSPATGAGEESWWQQFRTRLGQAERAIDFDRLRGWLSQRSGQMIDKFVSLLVIFLLNTVILPLAFLWAIFKLFKSLLSSATTVIAQRPSFPPGKPDHDSQG